MKKIIIAIIVIAAIFIVYHSLSSQKEEISQEGVSNITNSETTVLGALKALEKYNIDFSISDNCRNMLEKHPEYYDGSMLEVPATDKMVFGASYEDIIKNIDDNGNNLVNLPDCTVIAIYRSEKSNGINIIELLDSDSNYYMLVSDYNFENVIEGDEIGGFYTPAGKMKFTNQDNEDSVGIVGVIALHD